MKFRYLILISFLNSISLFGQNTKLGTIELLPNDAPGYYTISQAYVYLAQNKDWRLPTIEELQLIYNNRSTVGGLKYGGDAYLASGKQNNFKFPNSQAEYGYANVWALEFGSGRWVQPSNSTQLCVRLVRDNKTQVKMDKPTAVKEKKNNRTKNYSGDCITNYSGAFGLTGSNLDQTELQFNLETTYLTNTRFTQLYRWRYTMGDFKGLIFEYNNRVYFGKNRPIEPSKWYIQGKIGYGLLKGIDYPPGSLFYMDEITFQPTFNSTSVIDSRHMCFNYGLSLGYKWIIKDRITLDFYTGYTGFTTPDFQINSPFDVNLRENDWNKGIGFPIEFQWSIGFFLD